jgi:4-amino-4-deoxy-L-arabinose transferase-like glycosyltransferase
VSFRRSLAVLAAGGLALRLAYVLGAKWHMPVWGDAFVYHHQANLLAAGHGFITPSDWFFRDHTVFQSADHPPLFTAVLAAVSVLGGTSFGAHQLTGAAIGTATVVVVGLVGRAAAGERAGLLAAGLAALYPYVWVNDALVMSESLTMLTAALVALAAYRMWRAPSLGRAALVGLAVAAGALTRAELALLGPLVVVPATLGRRGVHLLRRAAWCGAAVAAALAAVGPWVAYNLSRFDEPVLLSAGLGITLRVANCPSTYRGELLGFWDFDCALREDLTGVGDQSRQDAELRRRALAFVADHRARVPVVVAARVGRLWGLYRPLQGARFDTGEARELVVSWAGLALLYPLMALSVAGTVILRRRRRPTYPLVALVVVATVAAAITFGNTRYRAPAEVALVVLAAVALDATWSRRTSRASGACPGAGRAGRARREGAVAGPPGQGGQDGSA